MTFEVSLVEFGVFDDVGFDPLSAEVLAEFVVFALTGVDSTVG